MEVLAPAGDMEKLQTAIYFGADAVYFAGKEFGLRAFSANFDNIAEPVKYCHEHGVKAYITVNVFSRNYDRESLINYLKEIEEAKADAMIISDIGVMDLAKIYAPNVPIHVSTQANCTSYMTALSYVEHYGATRIVLARELSIDEIREIAEKLKGKAEVEVFCHGAMCVSYSGRCLLSNYLTGRESNRGACAQPCRWNYTLHENSSGKDFGIEEDKNGSYILNSKDLCLIDYLDQLYDAGVASIKIEGRMKSAYYVATITNAYKRALLELQKCKENGKKYRVPLELKREVFKTVHRDYTTGFTFKDDTRLTMNYEAASQVISSDFVGIVRKVEDHGIWVEQRNRFQTYNRLEILSPGVAFQKLFTCPTLFDENGKMFYDAKNVQQLVFLRKKFGKTGIQPGDFLRRTNRNGEFRNI